MSSVRSGRGVLILVVALAFATPVQAQNVLVFQDVVLGISVVPGAISGLGLTASTATSISMFTSMLNGGIWDLVIMGEHDTSNGFFQDVALQAAMANHLGYGGALLAATWRTEPTGARPGPLVPFMEAATVVDLNQTPIFSDAHPIFAGVGGAITLIDPGWGVWSQSYAPGGLAQCLGMLGAGCAAILGNGGQTLLLGPLFDTYAAVLQGEQFVGNSIQYLLDTTTVIPEPIIAALLIPGLLGIALVCRRREGSLEV